MKLTKKTSLMKYIDWKQETEALKELSKEQLIERYLYRMNKACLLSLGLGFIMGMGFMILVISNFI